MSARVLRMTVYPTPDPDEAATFVMREEDLRLSLEGAERTVVEMEDFAFVSSEIFSMEGSPSIEEATVEADRRRAARLEDENNMAVMYYWNAAHLPLLATRGVLSATRPAPLTAAQIVAVFEQLARHREYRGQTVRSPASDGTWVELKDGRVTPRGERS